MSTARTFFYRERQLVDDSNVPAFNWHYDRMNMGAVLNDFYYVHGKPCPKPQQGAGLFYHVGTPGQIFQLSLGDEDVGLHIGMTAHILTAGIFPAACHSVFLPNVAGLSRTSIAFFLAPSPNVHIKPPVPCDIRKGVPEDA